MIATAIPSRKPDSRPGSSSAARHHVTGLRPISEDEAATRIQSYYRGARARRRLRRHSYRHHSESQPRSDGHHHQTATTIRGNDPVEETEPRRPSGEAQSAELLSRLQLMQDLDDAMDLPEVRMESNITDYSLMRYEMNRRSTVWPRPIQQLRVSLYLLFEEPRSSCVAQVLSILLLGFIILSIACFMLETMPELSHVDKDVWFGMEMACTIVFTVEYVVRLLVCTAGPEEEMTIWRFIRTPMNVCDLGAILPFYVSLLMSSLKIAKALGILRTVRLIRLFRIFKLGRYSSGLQLMAQALTNSSQALWVLGFFLFIGIVLFSSAIYYVEKMGCPERETLIEIQLSDGSNRTELDVYVSECRTSSNGMSDSHGLCCDEHGSPLDFPSIIEAFWWATVTMTTVGFGEVYPRTEVGRMVATATMLSGILLIALPVAIIGRKFQEAYDEHQAAMQGLSFCDTPRSLMDRAGTSGTSLPQRAASSMRRGSSGRSDAPQRKVSQKQAVQQKARDVSSNAPDGPTLSEMGRRLRLMKLPDGNMTHLAHDLAEELEEAGDVQKEINSMQAFEATRQAEVVEQFDSLLKRLCDLQTGGAALARLTKLGMVPGMTARGSMGSSRQQKGTILAAFGAGPIAGPFAESEAGSKPMPDGSTSARSVVTEVMDGADHPCAMPVSRHAAEDDHSAILPGSAPTPFAPAPIATGEDGSRLPTAREDSSSDASVHAVTETEHSPITPLGVSKDTLR